MNFNSNNPINFNDWLNPEDIRKRQEEKCIGFYKSGKNCWIKDNLKGGVYAADGTFYKIKSEAKNEKKINSRRNKYKSLGKKAQQDNDRVVKDILNTAINIIKELDKIINNIIKKRIKKKEMFGFPKINISIGDIVDDVVDTAKKGGELVVDTAKKGGELVVDTVNQGLDLIKKKDEIKKNFSKEIGNIFESIAKEIEERINRIYEELKKKENTYETKAKEAIKEAKEAIKEVKNGIFGINRLYEELKKKEKKKKCRRKIMGICIEYWE